MNKTKWKIDLRGIWGDLLFVLLFSILATLYYDSFLTKGPFTNHAWRQTDCLSLAHNYMDGASFLSPQVHNQLGDHLTSGKTAGEFPILYYVVGQIWKVTGESYFVYRIFYLLILFSGIFALFKSLRLLIIDWFWSTTIALLLFTSPVFIIYGVSFLTDIPAFCFVLIAGYFLTAYYFKKSKIFFWFAILFFCLAGLIKISSLIGFIFIFGVFILENLNLKTLKSSQLFKREKFEWIGFSAVILSILSWYSYASWYNDQHHFLYTFNSIYPLWLIDKKESLELSNEVKNFTSYFFFSRPVLYTLTTLGLINLFQWKKLPLFPYLANVAIIVGCAIYFLLWAPLMGVHDYYYGALLILFVGIVVPFFWVLKSFFKTKFKNKIFKIVGILFLVYNSTYSFGLVKMAMQSKELSLFKISAPHFYGKLEYLNYANQRWKRFEDIRPYLKKIGIKKEDKVISLPDNSFNISLYLMNQKGWTGYSGGDQTENIRLRINKGAKYMLISELEILEKENLKPFLSEQIGEFEGIYIFKLSR
jgi:hypothetical protein